MKKVLGQVKIKQGEIKQTVNGLLKELLAFL